jgi:transcriptional regulator with XRE-family HTH domain
MGITDYDKACAGRFRDQRLALGLSQAEIHRVTGIGKQTLVAFESGASILYIRNKEKLEGLGFDLQHVYFEGGLSQYFDFAGLFDITVEVVRCMDRNPSVIDREAAINALKAIFSQPQGDASYTGRVAKACLGLSIGKDI